MPVEQVDPEGSHPTPGYHHVTIAPAGRLAFLAGQCPLDDSGRLVAADLAAQVDRVVANALHALRGVGAAPTDVVRSVIYVVSTDAAVLGAVWERLGRSELGPAFASASTLIGVAVLGFAGQLVEVDLTAALG